MNQQKVFFTIAATAMTGIFIYSFLHEHNGVYCQICCSNGFALSTGIVLAYTYFLYNKD